MDSLVRSLGVWAYAIVFLIATGESAAFIGLAVPGETAVIAAAIAAQRGALDVWWVGAVAVAGAVLGDSIGYWVGHRFGECRDEGWLAKVWSCDRMRKAQRFWDRHGGRAVFLGRFVGLIRPLVPVFAGAVRMPYPEFFAYNVAGAVIWGAGSVAAGFFFGRAAEEILERAGLWGGVALAVAAVAGFLLWRWRRSRERERAGSGSA